MAARTLDGNNKTHATHTKSGGTLNNYIIIIRNNITMITLPIPTQPNVKYTNVNNKIMFL